MGDTDNVKDVQEVFTVERANEKDKEDSCAIIQRHNKDRSDFAVNVLNVVPKNNAVLQVGPVTIGRVELPNRQLSFR